MINSIKKNLLTIILIAVLILVLIFMKLQLEVLGSGAAPVESEKEEQTGIAGSAVLPSAVPSQAFDRSKWKLEVLNGSGVSGLAKRISGKLAGLGYSVVKTGNADSDGYEKTEIAVKKGFEAQVSGLIGDLKDAVKIASLSGELSEGNAAARIILGKDVVE